MGSLPLLSVTENEVSCHLHAACFNEVSIALKSRNLNPLQQSGEAAVTEGLTCARAEWQEGY